MIVGYFNGLCIAIDPLEDDPVPIIDSDRMESGSLSFERFQSIRRRYSQVTKIRRGVEHIQLASRQAPNNLRNTPRGLGINAVEYVFRRLVGEIQDHNERYAFNGIRASEKSRATGTCPPACP